MKLRIAGIIVLLIGGVFSILTLNSLWHDVPVWFFGRRATAVIEEKWWEDYQIEKGDRAVYYLKYYFKYTFSTENGEVFTGTAKVTEDEFLGFQPGGEITIKYSVLNPEINRVDDSRFVPFLTCSYIPVILACIFTIIAGKEMIDF
ncbi:MAG: hypothetical protein JW757_10810 [Anaerolineales bacterium]|nr:hypothetical protein [Anaerolineales bacterium]